jgi:hypothetical protein
MKIYFSASRLYKDKYSENYKEITEVLNESNCQVIDNTGFNPSPSGYDMPASEKQRIYRQMVKNMDRADFCVFEASYPSTLHIGHEISLAMEKNKPVIVLYIKDHEPILFRGINNDKLIWIEYNDETLQKVLSEAIEESKKNIDVRFNFFVSPKILSYLDWIAQKRMIPRSVFLRNLIEREMKKDKEFKS